MTTILALGLGCLLAVCWPPALAAKKSVPAACRGYALESIRIGMKESQLRRAFRGRPMEVSTLFDGSSEVRTYAFSDPDGLVRVRVRIAPGASSGLVEKVERRLIPVGGVEALLAKMKESLGTPDVDSGAAQGGNGLLARWDQPACGSTLSIESRRRSWWEGGGEEWVLRLEPYVPPQEPRLSTASVMQTRGESAGVGGAPAEKPGDSVGELVAPRRIFTVPPEFPLQARGRAREAVVKLDVTIDATGKVREIQVVKPAERRLGFDEAAVAAVRRWRYEPAMLGGRPVEAVQHVVIRFQDNPTVARPLNSDR